MKGVASATPRSQETLEQRRASWRADAAKRREFAQACYDALLRVLGGRCARCEGDETSPLTVDHVGGSRKWDIHQLSFIARVQRYIDEFYAGVELRALCIHCNTEDRNVRAKDLPDAPF